MAYSEIVMDHFFNPRNAYRMEDADVVGVAGDPEKGGPFMVLYLKLEGDRIAKASFQTYGCGPAIATGSLVSERLAGAQLAAAEGWDEVRINDAMGGLPMDKRHCSALAAEAVRSGLSQSRALAAARATHATETEE